MKAYRFTEKLVKLGALLVVSLLVIGALNACTSVQNNGENLQSKIVAQQNELTSSEEAAQLQSEPVQEPAPQEQLEAALPAASAAVEVQNSADPANTAASQPELPSPAEPTVQATANEAPPVGFQAAPAQAENPPTNPEPAAQQPLEQQPGSEVKPEVGFTAPDFTLASLDGQAVRLGEYRGGPVIINYWATWCVPCQQELPILQQLSQEFAGSGLRILTVNAIEQDTIGNVQSLVGQLGLTMPVLLDQQNQFQSSYNQLFFPTSYFIDGNGVIRWIKLGDATEAVLRENIQKLLNNQL